MRWWNIWLNLTSHFGLYMCKKRINSVTIYNDCTLRNVTKLDHFCYFRSGDIFVVFSFMYITLFLFYTLFGNEIKQLCHIFGNNFFITITNIMWNYQKFFIPTFSIFLLCHNIVSNLYFHHCSKIIILQF